jgi:hypothetical protein
MAADATAAPLSRHAEKALPVRAPIGVRALLGLLMVIGLVTFLTEVKSDPTQAYAAFLINHYVFLGFPLAAMLFISVHYLTGSIWSVAVRRVAESFTAYLPVALITFLVLAFGVPLFAPSGVSQVFVWSAPEAAHATREGYMTVTKGGWLSPGFWLARNFVYFAVWMFFGWRLVRNSLRQDMERGERATKQNTALAGPYVVLFALSVTLAGFDLLMSLEPTWFSTMFGVYCFAGIWQSTLAAIAMVTILLRRQGALDGIVTRAHYHDLGKLLIGFSVFWVYIAFSQLMLIWYGNLPEEVGWMNHRIFTGWGTVGILVGTLRFAIPFFVLLHQRMKENEIVLLAVCVGVLLGQWLDIYWVVLPALSPERVVFGWTEIGITMGFLGLFGWRVLSFLSRHPVAPSGDPLYVSSVRFHG